MIYKEFSPSIELKHIVNNYWVFDVEGKNASKYPLQHETIPESCVSIVLINQPYYQGVRILGPHTKKYHQAIFPKSIFFGVKIAPWLIFKPALFDKQKLINETSEAEEHLSEYFNDIFQKETITKSFSIPLIETKLIKLFNSLEIQQNDLVKFICTELSKKKSIATITNEIPFSIRVIQKTFKSVVGLTMKQYANNLRMRQVWVDLLNAQGSKLDIILNHDYYDQAHFINEFKNKMKRSHNDYEAYLKNISISLI